MVALYVAGMCCFTALYAVIRTIMLVHADGKKNKK